MQLAQICPGISACRGRHFHFFRRLFSPNMFSSHIAQTTTQANSSNCQISTEFS